MRCIGTPRDEAVHGTYNGRKDTVIIFDYLISLLANQRYQACSWMNEEDDKQDEKGGRSGKMM